MNDINAEMNIGAKIVQADEISIPQGIPIPLKNAPSPRPSVGVFKKGSVLGSSLASPTGLASAILFYKIVIWRSTHPTSWSGALGVLR